MDTRQLFPKRNREVLELFTQSKALTEPCVYAEESFARVRVREMRYHRILKQSKRSARRKHYERRHYVSAQNTRSHSKSSQLQCKVPNFNGKFPTLMSRHNNRVAGH